MTNRMWVTLLYLFARQSHQSCLIPWPVEQYVRDTGLLLCQAASSMISSHDQQDVGDTVQALCLCQAASSIMSEPHPITSREWVILLYLFARLSHELACLIPWPTASEWHCFICLCSLINHVSSHDPQYVSNTTLFLCQAVSLIMSHPMTNSKWVTLLYIFARQSHESCLIPWPMVCEWHCFNCLPGCLINHVSSCYQQHVSETALIVCHAV